MKDRLTKEEVLHVAHLARIELSDADVEKYQVELKILLDDIDKIKDVESYDEDFNARDKQLKEQSQIEIAKNMLKDDVSIEDISKYTTLSIEQIKNIKKD